ncbi:hypothetical protein CR513_33131, partial [Mucuna pruriens]
MFIHLGSRVMLVPLPPREVHEDKKMKIKKESERKTESKLKKNKGRVKLKRGKKKKKYLLVGLTEVRRVLLDKKELLFAVPTNMLLSASPSLNSFPTSMKDLLEEFQDVFHKEVPHGLPPLRGVEHHIDLILRAT